MSTGYGRMKEHFDRETAVSLEAITAENTDNVVHQTPVRKLTKEEDLMPEYMFAPESAKYLKTTTVKIALFRKYGLLKWSKLGKNYCYKKQWLDEFMEAWSGYDLSNERAIKLAVNSKKWKVTHGYES